VNFSDIGERILLAVVIIGILVLFSLIRGRNPRKEQADIVGTLLEETKLNIILTDTFERQAQQWPFHVTGWQLRKKKINFLDKDLRQDIDTCFGLACDFNQRLKTAVKVKSTKRETIDIDSMKTALPRVKQGLEDWLLANMGTSDHHKKQPGMTDWLFGGR
jgi:hypothetical protein